MVFVIINMVDIVNCIIDSTFINNFITYFIYYLIK